MTQLSQQWIADVMLWGTRVGAVAWDAEKALGFFEYDPAFLPAPVELAPLAMPKPKSAAQVSVFSFPSLNRDTYHGLPGMLADALPDRFGNKLIDRWLVEHDRPVSSFSPVERLCYVGNRGMGALEFRPAATKAEADGRVLHIPELVEFASQVLSEKASFREKISNDGVSDSLALENILLVGTSAGGARAKAVIAWNSQTQEVRSGQVSAGDGFDYWLLKFDGVSNNKDKELSDPDGYGRIEYAYSEMVKAAGIDMTECRLMEEGGRAHFMTKRFDRLPNGDKLHMQTLCALAHYDFNDPGAYSYEQAFHVIRQLSMPNQAEALEQLYRRMVFNIVGRNQDDHVKNISFLMNRKGVWSLAPAYDMTYQYNPQGDWTSSHQMRCNGKRDDFVEQDFMVAAKHADLMPHKARGILEEVVNVFKGWERFAAQAGVPRRWVGEIQSHLRLF